jgi:hypothetical protein
MASSLLLCIAPAWWIFLVGQGTWRMQSSSLITCQLKPNGATWGALLGAWRSYGNVELGELAAMERFKLEPKDPSTYVLLSNIYAAADKWQELMRTMVQERYTQGSGVQLD